MGSVLAELRKHRGNYGIDGAFTAVVGVIAMGAAGLVLAGIALIHARSRRVLSAVLELLSGLVLLQTVPSYLYSTRWGKFAVWAELLNGLQLRGDERVLDLGCGRGAILSIVAKAARSCSKYSTRGGTLLNLRFPRIRILK